MSEPGEPPELWECENCGRRAVGGEGDGWVVAGEDRGHACATIPARLGPRVAFRVGLDDAGRALLACVLAMGRWGEAVGGVHPEARVACAAARKLLGLPETGPPTGGEREGEERPCPSTTPRGSAELVPELREVPDVVSVAHGPRPER